MTEDNAPQETQTETPHPKAEEKVEEAEGSPKESGESQTEPSAIEKGEAIIKGIDEGMKKYEALVIRQEKAASRMLLGGKGERGEPAKTPEEEKTEKDKKEIDEAIERYR